MEIKMKKKIGLFLCILFTSLFLIVSCGTVPENSSEEIEPVMVVPLRPEPEAEPVEEPEITEPAAEETDSVEEPAELFAETEEPVVEEQEIVPEADEPESDAEETAAEETVSEEPEAESETEPAEESEEFVILPEPEEPVVVEEPVEEQESAEEPAEETAPVEETVIIEPPVEEPEPDVFTLEKLLLQLQASLDKNPMSETLALFETVPPEFSESFTVKYLYATLLFSAGRYPEAAEITDWLFARYPDDADVLTLKMMLAKATGKSKDKTAVLNQIIQSDPYNTDANTELGDEQMLKKNWQKANTYYLTALAGNATNIDALAGYGQSSYYLGKLTESERTFKKMIDLDPQNAYAYSYLGKLAAEKYNYKEAVSYALKALEIEPDSYDYWLDYGTFLREQNKVEEAEQAWTKAISLRPDYFLGYVYRAGLYDDQDNIELALADYLQVVKCKPEYYFAYESLGVLFWIKGDYAAARNWFTKAYEMYPSNNIYSLIIAVSYYREGKAKDGKNYISKTVLKKFSKDSLEYAVARLFYDNVGPGTVATKIQNETNANRKAQMLFYLAEYYTSRSNFSLAQKYYILVHEMETPNFFEYRLNEYAITE